MAFLKLLRKPHMKFSIDRCPPCFPSLILHILVSVWRSTSPMMQGPVCREAVFTQPLPSLGKLSSTLRDASGSSSGFISHKLFFLAAKFWELFFLGKSYLSSSSTGPLVGKAALPDQDAPCPTATGPPHGTLGANH